MYNVYDCTIYICGGSKGKRIGVVYTENLGIINCANNDTNPFVSPLCYTLKVITFVYLEAHETKKYTNVSIHGRRQGILR